LPFIIRVSRNKNNWIIPEQFEDGQIPGDVLKDLNTEKNTLSLFRLENKEALKRFVPAFASSRNKEDKFDYILFDSALLKDFEPYFDESKKSNLPDHEVNKWHFDITTLSAQNILSLAEKLINNSERCRISVKDVNKQIIKAVDAGWVQLEDIPQHLREQLEI